MPATCGALCGRNRQQPKQRGHHDLRPGGTSQAQFSPAIRVKVDKGSGRFLAPLEWGAIIPYAVQDDGQFASNSDPRLFHSIAFRQLQPPKPSMRTSAGSDGVAHWRPRRDTFAAGDRPIARLGRRCPFRLIACVVASGSDRPHGRRTSKARRVEGMAEAQCRYHADAWHGHQPSCCFVCSSHLSDLAVQPIKLLSNIGMHGEQW